MLLLVHASVGIGHQTLHLDHGCVNASSLAIYTHVQWQEKWILTQQLACMQVDQQSTMTGKYAADSGFIVTMV